MEMTCWSKFLDCLKTKQVDYRKSVQVLMCQRRHRIQTRNRCLMYNSNTQANHADQWWCIRDRHFIKNSATSKFVHFAEIFLKNVVITSKLIFFKFLAFFRHVLVVSYLQMQQTKNRWIIGILLNHFFAIFKVSRAHHWRRLPITTYIDTSIGIHS